MNRSTAPQDADRTPQDHSELRSDAVQPHHYEARKNDLVDPSAAGALQTAAGAETAAAIPETHGSGVKEDCPEAFTGLRVSKVPKAAAGLKGVVAALQHVWAEMGVIRGARALLR